MTSRFFLRPRPRPRGFSLPVSLVALALAVAGCSVLQPTQDPTSHFFLQSSRTSKITSGSGLVVLVGPVTIPGYLDHKQLVTAEGSNNLKLAEFSVWAEDLDQGVARVVAENLSHLIDSPAVAPFPAVNPPEHDYQVTLVIRRFEMAADHRVHLVASYLTAGSSGSSRPPVRTSSRSLSVPVTNPQDPASIAHAMSRALGDLSRSIAKGVLAVDRQHQQALKAERAKAISPEPRE